MCVFSFLRNNQIFFQNDYIILQSRKYIRFLFIYNLILAYVIHSYISKEKQTLKIILLTPVSPICSGPTLSLA